MPSTSCKVCRCRAASTLCRGFHCPLPVSVTARLTSKGTVRSVRGSVSWTVLVTREQKTTGPMLPRGAATLGGRQIRSSCRGQQLAVICWAAHSKNRARMWAAKVLRKPLFVSPERSDSNWTIGVYHHWTRAGESCAAGWALHAAIPYVRERYVRELRCLSACLR